MPVFRLDQAMGGAVLPTLARTDIFQFRGLGGDQPVNLHPFDGDLSVTVNHQEDFDLFEEVAAKGEPVDFFFDYWVIDLWRISDATSGQTIWKTSRKLPYSIAGITHATRPPEAFIDEAAQTVITSGTPTSGEVKVPTVSGYADIETPSGIAGTHLKLRYPALMVGRFLDLRRSYTQANDLRFRLRFQEVRTNLYTAGTA